MGQIRRRRRHRRSRKNVNNRPWEKSFASNIRVGVRTFVRESADRTGLENERLVRWGRAAKPPNTLCERVYHRLEYNSFVHVPPMWEEHSSPISHTIMLSDNPDTTELTNNFISIIKGRTRHRVYFKIIRSRTRCRTSYKRLIHQGVC